MPKFKQTLKRKTSELVLTFNKQEQNDNDMWHKITRPDQLSALEAGENIIKYPVSGEPTVDFNDANPDNISLRVVTQNDPINEMIAISIRPSSVKYNAILGIGGVVFGPVEKSYDAVIAEGMWWYFDPSTEE